MFCWCVIKRFPIKIAFLMTLVNTYVLKYTRACNISYILTYLKYWIFFNVDAMFMGFTHTRHIGIHHVSARSVSCLLHLFQFNRCLPDTRYNDSVLQCFKQIKSYSRQYRYIQHNGIDDLICSRYVIRKIKCILSDITFNTKQTLDCVCSVFYVQLLMQ